MIRQIFLYTILCIGVIVTRSISEAAMPNISIAQFKNKDVTLIPFGDPGFSAALTSQPAVGYQALLPYTVAIRNNSDKHIIAYTVIWSGVGSHGEVTSLGARVAYDFSRLPNGAILPAHQTRIASTLSSLESGGTYWDEHTARSVERIVQKLSTESSVTIGLDSILFADGSSVGPDTMHWCSRWKSWLEAEKAVFTVAVDTPQAQLSATLQEFLKPANEIFRREHARDINHFTDLAAMSDRSDSYNDCLALIKGYFAGAILEEIRKGDMPTIENLRQSLRVKQYPSVH